jgi:CHRD domain/PEP-CTERM motif
LDRVERRRIEMKRNTAFGLALLAVALLVAPRAKADGIFTATLLGSNEVPPTGSSATGTILVTVTGDLLAVDESFAGLIGGPAAAAHIHCCAPSGVNTGVAVPFVSFPPVTSGTYVHTFDLALFSTYSSAFLNAHGGTAAGAETALLDALFAGEAYANIHDAEFPGGEIRGQLTQQTPEPGTMMLLGMGLCLVSGMKRLRRISPLTQI